jgi:hypothetical protein
MHSYLIIPYRNNVNCRLVLAVKKVLLLTFGLFPQVIFYRNCKISNNIGCDIDMNEGQRVPVKNIQNLDSFALGPFFERFFILGGPRGFREKKLQKIETQSAIF